MQTDDLATAQSRLRHWRAPWTANRIVAASGVLLAAGGGAIGLAAIMHPDGPHPPVVAEMVAPSYAFWHLAAVAGYACVAAAIPGVTAFQLQRYRALSLADVVGYLLTSLGAVCYAGVLYADGLAVSAVAKVIPKVFDLNGDLFGAPFLAGPSSFASTTFAVGAILFGVPSLHRASMPRAAVIAFIVGAVLVGLPLQPVSPIPQWFATIGGLAIAFASISIGRWIWQGGPLPSRLPPLPRGRQSAAESPPITSPDEA